MPRFAARRPDPAAVAPVDWPAARGGVRAGYVPLGVVSRVAGASRESTWKLARRLQCEGRIRLHSTAGRDSLGRVRRRVVVSESDGAYLVAVHRGEGEAVAPVRDGREAETEGRGSSPVLVSGGWLVRLVDIARSCGVRRSATVRLARRHGVRVLAERLRDSRGRRRRMLATYTPYAARLEALHRAGAERWPEPPAEVEPARPAKDAPARAPVRQPEPAPSWATCSISTTGSCPCDATIVGGCGVPALMAAAEACSWWW